jgi:hypothetical protein
VGRDADDPDAGRGVLRTPRLTEGELRAKRFDVMHASEGLASAYSAIAITGAWEDSVADAHLAVERRRRADSGGDAARPSG